MDRFWRTGLVLGLLVSIGGLGRVEAGPINPAGYSAYGPLTLGPGNYDFDTAQSGSPVLYSNINGSLTTVATGVYSAGVAVFDFTSITIGKGASVSYLATGAGAPIALLSTSTVEIDGTINVSAGASSDPKAFIGRPYQAPGTSNIALGGNGTMVSGSGGGPGNYAFSGGGGGGFGGSGTNGQLNYIFNSSGGIAAIAPGGVGGSGSFNLSTYLQGGSGGGSGNNGGSGGSGGGAIEIVATTTLTVSGTILANGEAGFSPSGLGGGGGGGSGGGIYLSAYSMNLSGTLSALGGSGARGQSYGLTNGSGGAGGGGLILAEYYNLGTFTNTGSGNAGNGRFDIQSVPEPASLVMLSVSVLGLIAASAIRRRAFPRNIA